MNKPDRSHGAAKLVQKSSHPLTVTYIGGPTSLIEANGLRFLTDPTFDEPGRTYTIPRVGAQTKKLVGPSLAASQIGAIDVVLLSHDEHSDNLDDAGKNILPMAKVVLTTQGAAERLRGNARGLRPFESYEYGDIKITATPARHGPEGCEPLLGDVIGFVVESKSGAFDAFYVSGDTVYYDGLLQIKDRFKVKTAFLHLGRVGGAGEPHFTMGAEEASKLTEFLNFQTVIPLHYEDWAHFSEDRAHAAAFFASRHLESKIHWLDRGVATAVG